MTGLDPDFHKKDVDFPTIVVCPLEPFEEKSVNVTVTAAGGDFNFQQFLKDLPSLSYEHFPTSYDSFDSENVIFEENMRELAFEVGIKCGSVFNSCKYRGKEVSCCKVFKPFYTEHGFCYAFNGKYISSAKKE